MKLVDRAVLTIATGQPLYLRLAINLARSFGHWHKQSDIKFVLVTDSEDDLPADLEFVSIVRIKPEELGAGFSPKLHLDELSPANKTLFVDADCLCAGPLDEVFERFDGHDVSVVGEMISRGEFFGDVANRCRHFEVSAIPLFVGSVYYLERGDISKQVFSLAREIELKYDELGFVRLRGKPNEEPLISVGMAKFQQLPLADDGKIKADAHMSTSIKCDVLSGKVAVQRKNFVQCTPKLLHFNCCFADRPPYTSEAFALELVKRWSLPRAISRYFATMYHLLPYIAEIYFKDIFRPIYRRIFGVRRIRSTRS